MNPNFDSINVQQRRPGSQSFEDPQATTSSGAQPPFNLFNQAVASSVGAYMFSTGREKAQQALNIYSHIDYMRPYFDVEPRDVLNRLLHSLNPIDPATSNKLPTELYGPLMIIFTLCAILIYQMKMASHSIQDGTLIGTAFFVCFSYWLGVSFLLSSASFVCNTSISLVNYLSLIGYALFSHCVVLLIGTFLHTSYDHFIFYFLWATLSGAASLKLAYLLFTNTQVTNYKIPLAVFIIIAHMGFLLYLHFAYHELAEEVSHALFDKVGAENLPAKLTDSMVKNAASGLVNESPVVKIPNTA